MLSISKASGQILQQVALPGKGERFFKNAADQAAVAIVQIHAARRCLPKQRVLVLRQLQQSGGEFLRIFGDREGKLAAAFVFAGIHNQKAEMSAVGIGNAEIVHNRQPEKRAALYSRTGAETMRRRFQAAFAVRAKQPEDKKTAANGLHRPAVCISHGLNRRTHRSSRFRWFLL